jgi:hypothetical protein
MKAAESAPTEPVRAPEHSLGRLVGSGIIQVMRTKSPPDNGLGEASLSARTAELGSTRGRGIGREIDQFTPSPG